MKIEIIYDNEGNVFVIDSKGDAEYIYCENGIPEQLLKMLRQIQKYDYEDQ